MGAKLQNKIVSGKVFNIKKPQNCKIRMNIRNDQIFKTEKY